MGKIMQNGKEIANSTNSYTSIENKPTLNGVEISGDRTSYYYNIMWVGTQAQFDALTSTNPNCLYIITDTDSQYDFSNVFNKSEVLALLNNKQNITDTSLATTAKTVPLAINELNSKIASMGGIVHIEVVESTPAEPVNGTMYYIHATGTTYNIRLYNDGVWTDMGTTSMDVSTLQPKAWTNTSYTAQTIEGALGEVATDYTKKTDVIDALNSTETQKPLSANQGKVLNDSKVNISDIKDNLTSTDADKPLSANQGKVLKELDDAKLPLAGGSLTGAIIDTTTGDASGFNHPAIKRADDTYTVEITGGSDVSNGAFLRLGGGSHSLNGGFRIAARKDASTYKILMGETTGELTWGGEKVPVLKSQVFTGTSSGTGAISIGTIGQEGRKTVPLYAIAHSGYQISNTDHLIIRAGQGYYTAYSQSGGTLQAHINATYKITVYYLEYV